MLMVAKKRFRDAVLLGVGLVILAGSALTHVLEKRRGR
jgi:hypothetical protein